MHPCVGCICATFCAISGLFRPPVFIFSCDVSTSPFLSPSTPCLFFHFEYGWLPWKPPPPPPLAHYQLLLLQYLRLVVVAWQLVTQCFLATGPPEGSANPEPLCISNPRIPLVSSSITLILSSLSSSITRRLSASHMLYLLNDSQYSILIYLSYLSLSHFPAWPLFHSSCSHDLNRVVIYKH